MVKPEYMNDTYQMFEEREKEEGRASPARAKRARKAKGMNKEDWAAVATGLVCVMNFTFLAAAL